MKRMVFVLMLLMTAVPALADKKQCGVWTSSITSDAMSDARMEIAMTGASDGAFGFRCSDGVAQIALVSQRYIVTKQFGTYTGNMVKIRVDDGEVHELPFLKAGTSLWVTMGDHVQAILAEARSGSKIVVRVMEPNNYEDFVFSANGVSQCSRVLTCMR